MTRKQIKHGVRIQVRIYHDAKGAEFERVRYGAWKAIGVLGTVAWFEWHNDNSRVDMLILSRAIDKVVEKL